MKKWTWQWLFLLGVFLTAFTVASVLTEIPYDLDYDLIKPDQPWKQLIWECKVEGP